MILCSGSSNKLIQLVRADFCYLQSTIVAPAVYFNSPVFTMAPVVPLPGMPLVHSPPPTHVLTLQSQPCCLACRNPFLNSKSTGWVVLSGTSTFPVIVCSSPRTSFNWNPLSLYLCSLDCELFEDRQRTFFASSVSD